MSWLANPKVRLALIVNGLYFISFFIPTTPHTRPRFFAREYDGSYESPKLRRAPVYATLPPPSGPSKAATWVSGEGNKQLDVYLTNDLTLVRKPGYRLMLSPTFTTNASVPEAPDTVLLRFVIYADKERLSGTRWLSITADDQQIWPEDLDNRDSDSVWLQSSANEAESGGTVGTAAIALPYESFVETISARQVIIQFGIDRVELTAEQIEALRDMHRRLPQPPPPDEKPEPPSRGLGIGPKY